MYMYMCECSGRVNKINFDDYAHTDGHVCHYNNYVCAEGEGNEVMSLPIILNESG